MVPVLEDFKRALNQDSESDNDEGIKLIYSKFNDTLKNQGLIEVEVNIGDIFDPEIHEAISQIPAIDEELLNKVEQQIDDDGVKATFFGPIAGRPYKIYAVYAGAKDISFPSFLLVSIPARLLRFILLTWITWWVANKLLTKLQTRQKAFVLTAVWIAFYSWYFATI